MTNDTAVIFLNNKLIKDRKHLDTLGEELSKKSTELSQLESAVSSIQNKGTAEYDKANEVWEVCCSMGRGALIILFRNYLI